MTKVARSRVSTTMLVAALTVAFLQCEHRGEEVGVLVLMLEIRREGEARITSWERNV